MTTFLHIARLGLLLLLSGGTLQAADSKVLIAATKPDTNHLAASPAGASQFASSWGDRLKHGGPAAVVQIGLSIFGAGFIFERLARLRRKYLVPDRLADQARRLWREGKFDELEKLGETNPSTLARVIAFIARNRQSSLVEVSEVCGEMVSRELAAHYQRAYPLGIVATLEPLLGLLGMILGMISTFETVALAGSLGDATQLAGGISEALVTTALGLAIAIPFLAAYHFFKHRTTNFGGLLEEELTSLMTEWFMRPQQPR